VLLEDEPEAAARIVLRLLDQAPDPAAALRELVRDLGDGDHRARLSAVLLTLGEQSVETGDYGRAELLLGAVLDLEPESPAALALLGRARVFDSRYRSAEAPLEAAVALGRRDLETLLHLASARWENGRLDAAEETLRQAVDDGRPAVALHQLGRLLRWRGRYQEAVELLREASARSGGRVDVELDLAQALHGARLWRDALQCYRRVTALAPEDSKARYGLAQTLMQLGDREAAKRELEIYRYLYQEEQERTRLLGIEEAQVGRAHELLREGRPDQAVVLLRALPERPETLVALGLSYRAAGDRSAALAALERAVALDPEREDARALLTEMRLAADER
jgi:tetratricopeptide (TPR) repeat protein